MFFPEYPYVTQSSHKESNLLTDDNLVHKKYISASNAPFKYCNLFTSANLGLSCIALQKQSQNPPNHIYLRQFDFHLLDFASDFVVVDGNMLSHETLLSKIGALLLITD